MAKLTFFLSFLTLLLCTSVSAQERFTISGTLRDKTSGEELIGATVTVKELPNTGIAANEYGFYSLSLPKGKYTLRASFIGYNEKLEPITLDKYQNRLANGKRCCDARSRR
jgi:CarboxypepD_reg-like domain